MELNKIKFKKFFEAQKSYAIKAIEMLSETYADNNISIVQKNVWVKSNNRYIMECKSNQAWDRILFGNRNILASVPEFKECSDIILRDEKLSKYVNNLVGTYTTKRRLRIDEFINPILLKILQKQKKCVFNLKIFQEEYQKLENELLSDYYEQTILVILNNFNCDKKIIQIDDEISIVKLKEEEIIRMLDFGMKPKEIFPGILHESEIDDFAISIKYKLPKIFEDPKQDNKLTNKKDQCACKHFEGKIIETLRIYQKGEVYLLDGITWNNGYFYQAESCSFSQNHGIYWRGPAGYNLRGKDIKNFVQLYHKIINKKVSDKKFLSIAIRHFKQSLDKQNHEDKIIDLITCAEALFLNELGGYQGELKYRLSERAAFFLSDKPKERIRLFNLIKNIYDVRSKIVHGSDNKLKLPKRPDGEEYEIRELSDLANDLIRQALKRFIDLSQKPDSPKYLVDWEKLIFSK